MTPSPFFRSAVRVFEAAPSHDGDGVPLLRAFPGAEATEIDPFLLLDEMGPVEFAPGKSRGFPPHPHRGFETVTYLLEGEMQHQDSWGNRGLLRPGDVQWMTAGSGLVHSEMPGPSIAKNGGRLHGFQLWVNLPAKDKMLPPRYQDTSSDRIPVARAAGGRVTARVIAGEALGVRGVIETRIPIVYLHLTLAPGAEFQQDLPRESNAFVYIVEGELDVGSRRARKSEVAVFDRAGKAALLRNPGNHTASAIFVAGQAIGEPVARRGPFVMNTREELAQAANDYHLGLMGTLEKY